MKNKGMLDNTTEDLMKVHFIQNLVRVDLRKNFQTLHLRHGREKYNMAEPLSK